MTPALHAIERELWVRLGHPHPACGLWGTYTNLMCRCDACRDTHRIKRQLHRNELHAAGRKSDGTRRTNLWIEDTRGGTGKLANAIVNRELFRIENLLTR